MRFIRGMRKFSGAEELAGQMATDDVAIRGILGVPGRTP